MFSFFYYSTDKVAPARGVRCTCKPLLAIYCDENGVSFLSIISDKKAACFALGGALKAREFWTLLKCELECCTANDCNTQTPTLSGNAIAVFTSDGNKRYKKIGFYVACDVAFKVY